MVVGTPTTRTATISVDGGRIDTGTITAGGSKAICSVAPFDIPPDVAITKIDLPSNGATAVITCDTRGKSGTDNYTLTFTVSEIATA